MKTLFLMLILSGATCALAGCQSFYVEQKRTPVPGGFMRTEPMKFQRDDQKAAE